MSKPNKVNKSNYDQGGRLTPDEMARERKKMGEGTKVRGLEGAKERTFEGPKERITGRAAREPNRARSAPEE
jgi:hypothetical protein